MQVFRLITKNDSEEENDKYASNATKTFDMVCYDVELTFISDSLGTTFFFRWGEAKRLEIDNYINAIKDFRRCISIAYKGTHKVVRLEALD